MNVIALVGLSGVGKSTLLRAMAQQFNFLHLIASELIKAELARNARFSVSSEQLRLGPVVDNQQLLINAFLREAESTTCPTVLDGHVLIDGADGLVPIPTEVFKRIGTKHMIFLQDEPHSIIRRRGLDKTRSRPNRTEAELADQQDFAINVAARISRQMAIDMVILTPAVPDLLEVLLASGKI